MSAKLVLGVSLLLAAAASFAGGASGQFAVQITLNNNSNSNSICTSASGSAAGSSSVQVQCTSNVFVEIAPVTPQAAGRFMPGFLPARDSLLPDYCRNEQMGLAGQMARIACGLDDDQGPLAYADDEADEGWKVESQLYAVDTHATQAQTALLRLEDKRGTLLALRVAHADGHFGPVEMLISF
ncbi:hypothetical protein [Polaromonas sp. UBA4122]|uniref:hypothetical protein n=1 Tax=Polaromonas sp. UBA4122 TaxID=1947074 RepID=UPI0025FA74F3|nr:hypothetical protein [Polaromonas sp. UBA4122]